MKNAPSQRQLQVGELIRHSLSTFFLRGELPQIDGTSVTVSEVRISPDLRNATAYIYPLGGKNLEKVAEILVENQNYVRHYVAKEIQLRVAPYIQFKLDKSYEYAGRIGDLLNQVRT